MKYDSYVICTSPRSGSTLLCNLLATTGVAGNPASYFHFPSISDWLNNFNLTPDASMSERNVLDTIIKAAIAEGSLDTGMFGLRIQRHSFDYFTQKLAILYPELSSDTQRFHEAFGRTAFLHLTRRDKFEQAISYVKAEQTGLWHMAADGTEIERLSPPQAAAYDPERIGACFEEMKSYDRHWERWFVTENIVPLRISYEELSAHPIKMLREILGHLGLDCEATSDVEPGVAKMADKTSQDWVARFRSEHAST
jgi:LPS sulfotransferase NodH